MQKFAGSYLQEIISETTDPKPLWCQEKSPSDVSTGWKPRNETADNVGGCYFVLGSCQVFKGCVLRSLHTYAILSDQV
ncbi:hypothetical protein QYF36_004762 [Acer negundo]|nr:hypothetical protein QYF36_004762 [Acer negundo]